MTLLYTINTIKQYFLSVCSPNVNFLKFTYMVHTIRVLYQKPRMDRKYCLIVFIVYKSFRFLFNRKMQKKMKMIYFLSVKRGMGSKMYHVHTYLCFVHDQHAWLDFYSASPLNQQSAGKHVVSLVHNPNSEPTSLCFCYLKLCPW
jgi:hypothetical protein